MYQRFRFQVFSSNPVGYSAETVFFPNQLGPPFSANPLGQSSYPYLPIYIYIYLYIHISIRRPSAAVAFWIRERMRLASPYPSPKGPKLLTHPSHKGGEGSSPLVPEVMFGLRSSRWWPPWPSWPHLGTSWLQLSDFYQFFIEFS